MKRNIYLYLFVFSALIALFIYFNFNSIAQQQSQKINELEAKVERLENENRDLLKRLAS
jgi:cell division protein FtsL